MILSHPKPTIQAEITLPGSKSESNRALIMQALCKTPFQINNLSVAEDTVTLKSILSNPLEGTIDVGPAGTAMRFLTAFLAVTPGDRILTGSKRMLERPIKLLVDALKIIGADIEYLAETGYPPVRIHGGSLDEDNMVTIAGDVSSQYISALLMIAPTLPQGLHLKLTGMVASRPYIEMTLAMMAELGVAHKWKDDMISIRRQDYTAADIFIEPDWSAASYWYSMLALSEGGSVKLNGLKGHSLQGDSVMMDLMRGFGIETEVLSDGILLTKTGERPTSTFIDFEHCPDIAQTFAVICAGLHHNCTFTGLESLKIKETDRVAALQNELGKFGVKLIEDGLNYQLDCSESTIGTPNVPQSAFINTYHDHRMAMAFAPLFYKVPELEIEDPKVTGKSYPSFWDDVSQLTIGN